MKAIGDTKWYPPRARTASADGEGSRPDWVLSRQRAWGVPLAIFVDKKRAKSSTMPA
jgi:isoleucyl-tRNA synthetase